MAVLTVAEKCSFQSSRKLAFDLNLGQGMVSTGFEDATPWLCSYRLEELFWDPRARFAPVVSRGVALTSNGWSGRYTPS